MNKKMIGLAIIPIIGLFFIVLSTESDTKNLPENIDLSENISTESIDPITSESLVQNCSGDAKCIVGNVTKIIDGSSIHVDDMYVRFSLASSPALMGSEGVNSKDFIQTICPIGSEVLVDEDDGYASEGHSRIVGLVYCNDMILNKELLDANLGYLSDRFCDSSEFANDSWAQKHGC